MSKCVARKIITDSTEYVHSQLEEAQSCLSVSFFFFPSVYQVSLPQALQFFPQPESLLKHEMFFTISNVGYNPFSVAGLALFFTKIIAHCFSVRS
jgi:hypothetical protein